MARLTVTDREAKRFILHKNVCFHSTTIRCYLTGEHRHEIKRRKALSKAENYFKKLNIPTRTLWPFPFRFCFRFRSLC